MIPENKQVLCFCGFEFVILVQWPNPKNSFDFVKLLLAYSQYLHTHTDIATRTRCACVLG